MNDDPTGARISNPTGPLWLPTAQVERMMRQCKEKTTETVQIRRDELEGLLHDSLLWRQERPERDRLRAALERFAKWPIGLSVQCVREEAQKILNDEHGDLPQPPYTVTKTDDGLFLERGSDETPLPPASNPSLYDVLVEAGSYFRQQQEVHAGYRDGPYWGGLAVAAAREAAKALESPVETSGDSEVERLTRERDHFQTLAAVRGRELLKRAELLQEVQAQVDQLKCSHGWSAGMCPAEDCVHYTQDSCYRHCEVFPKGRGCPKCNAEKAKGDQT